MTPQEVGTALRWGGPAALMAWVVLDGAVLRRRSGLKMRPSQIPTFLRLGWPQFGQVAKRVSAGFLLINLIDWYVTKEHILATGLHAVQETAKLTAFVAAFPLAAEIAAACIAGALYSPLSRAPGFGLHRVAEFIVPRRTFKVVLEPVLSDMQVEFFDALAGGRPLKARWVKWRGYGNFWITCFLQLPISVSRVLFALWRSGQP